MAMELSSILPVKAQRSRGRRWAGWLILTLCALSAAVLIYGITTATHVIHPDDLGPTITQWLFAVLPALVFAAVGILITSRHPMHPIGQLCLAVGVAFPLWYITWMAPAFARLSAWAPWSALLSQVVFSLVLTLPLTFIVLLFPSGHLPAPRWRWAAWVTGGAALLNAVATIGQPILHVANEESFLNPLYTNDVWSWASSIRLTGTLSTIAGIATLVVLLLAIGSLGARWRKAEAQERQQLKWLFFTATTGLLFVIIGILAQEWGFTASGFLILMLGTPITIAIAVLRYRLYDIDFIINRALVYAALTVFVVGGYVLIVGAIGALLGTQGNLLLSLIATGLVAVAFHPVRERLQRGVNRLVYGQRREPYAVVSQLGRQLESSLPQNDILRAIAQTVGQTLKLSAVDISVVNGGVTRWESEAASVNAMPQSFALTYRGELLGEMRIILRPGEHLQDADRALLNDLARQAAIAVHSAQITADLQRSRERIVTAREEERRRLRRDLHDGLGPTLASLYQRMETVLPMLTTNPAEVAPLLTDARAQIKDAIASIRQIVYALRPPVLDELGLAAAVREESYRLFRGGNAPHVEVIAPENLPQLSAAVAAAAYRIIMEALANVLRHSGATHCQIIIQWQAGDRALVLEISDDGTGLPEEYRSGVGMQSMRERAEELGGRVSIEPRQPVGTLVRAVLPISTDAA